MSDPPHPPGPYLIAALLCDRVLQETDNVKSAIRIVDHIIQTGHGPDAPETMHSFVYETAMLLVFKRSGPIGPFQVAVTFVDPAEKVTTVFRGELRFSGENLGEGVDIVGRIGVEIERPGLFWFDVRVDEVLVTRVPLRVTYRKAVTPAAAPERA